MEQKECRRHNNCFFSISGDSQCFWPPCVRVGCHAAQVEQKECCSWCKEDRVFGCRFAAGVVTEPFETCPCHSHNSGEKIPWKEARKNLLTWIEKLPNQVENVIDAAYLSGLEDANGVEQNSGEETDKQFFGAPRPAEIEQMLKDSQNSGDWEGRFADTFCGEMGDYTREDYKAFIREEIDRAERRVKEELREKVEELPMINVEGMGKASSGTYVLKSDVLNLL